MAFGLRVRVSRVIIVMWSHIQGSIGSYRVSGSLPAQHSHFQGLSSVGFLDSGGPGCRSWVERV